MSGAGEKPCAKECKRQKIQLAGRWERIAGWLKKEGEFMQPITKIQNEPKLKHFTICNFQSKIKKRTQFPDSINLQFTMYNFQNEANFSIFQSKIAYRQPSMYKTNPNFKHFTIYNLKLKNEPNLTTRGVFYYNAVSLIAAGDSTLLPFSFYLLPFFKTKPICSIFNSETQILLKRRRVLADSPNSGGRCFSSYNLQK
jgi:hypothetical protein